MKKERLRLNINPDCQVARNIDFLEKLIREMHEEIRMVRKDVKTLQRELERARDYSGNDTSKTVPRTASDKEFKWMNTHCGEWPSE